MDRRALLGGPAPCTRPKMAAQARPLLSSPRPARCADQDWVWRPLCTLPLGAATLLWPRVQHGTPACGMGREMVNTQRAGASRGGSSQGTATNRPAPCPRHAGCSRPPRRWRGPRPARCCGLASGRQTSRSVPRQPSRCGPPTPSEAAPRPPPCRCAPFTSCALPQRPAPSPHAPHPLPTRPAPLRTPSPCPRPTSRPTRPTLCAAACSSSSASSSGAWVGV
jgi:hypothetical protein